MLANKSRLFRSIIEGLTWPFAGSLNSNVEVGPSTTPSALRAFSTMSGWIVCPCVRRPACPVAASSILNPRSKRSEVARRTASVAAVISGPMPSPGRTRRCIRVVQYAVGHHRFFGDKGQSIRQQSLYARRALPAFAPRKDARLSGKQKGRQAAALSIYRAEDYSAAG